MARPGISYSDVESAANQLKEEDRNPTIETVRALLGTGSSSTINMHLRKWKGLQGDTQKLASKENLPIELISLMKALWEQTINQANVRIETLEQTHQEDLAGLHEEADKYKTNNQRWQQMYHKWTKDKEALTNEKLAQEQALAGLQKEYTSLFTKQDALLQQNQEKQERINELHQLHSQTQANLEHYREAAREQRLLDQQQFEQQKSELQITVNFQKEQAATFNSKNNKLQQEYRLLEQSYTELSKQYQQTLGQNTAIQQELTELQLAKNEAIQAQKQDKSSLLEAQQKILDQTKQLIDLQVQNKILEKQYTSSKQELDDKLYTIKLLSNEKWILAEEKAQLEGRLKQIQTMVEGAEA